MCNTKKVIFPSLIAICVACPAFAIDIDVTGKISGSTAMCNVESGLEEASSTKFTAIWNPIEYTCDPGTYLSAEAVSCVQCTQNHYCPGGTFSFDSSDAGIEDCPSAYPYSDAGTSSSNMCYTSGSAPCSTLNPVSVGTASYANNSASYRIYASNPGVYVTDTIGFCAITLLFCPIGSTLSPATNGALANYIGQSSHISQSNTKWRALSGSTDGTDSSSTAIGYGNSSGMSNGTGEVAWTNNAKIHYRVSCNEKTVNGPLPNGDCSVSATGQFCWCNMDSYTLPGSSTAVSTPDTDWVLAAKFGSTAQCSDGCSYACLEAFRITNNFTNQLFGSYGEQMACELADIICAPGTYLPANSTTCLTCPAGSYCEGGTFNASGEDQGIHLCRNPYTSAAGTSSQYMCYQTATRECAMMNPYTGGHGTASYSPTSEHGKTYSGYSNVFVFDNINACAMTLSCDTGYLAVPGGVLSNYVFKNVNLGDSTALRFRALSNGEGSLNQGETGLSAGEWRVTWSDNTYVHGYVSCNNTGTDASQLSTLQTQYNNNEITQAQYVDAVIGDSGIGVRPASTFNTSSTGTHCWCQMDSYALQGGGAQSIQNSLWREITAGADSQMTETECANSCAYYCALLMGGQTIYRRPFFGSLGATPYCGVNSTIVLNWYNQNTLLDTNSCTYGDAIVFPSETGTRTGYHATGWHVREQQTPENP